MEDDSLDDGPDELVESPEPADVPSVPPAEVLLEADDFDPPRLSVL